MTNNNWLKYLVAISAIMIAGSAAYFSVTGLGVLFSGAAVAVMVMAGSLEFAKLVTATYLKQEWDNIKGINKWYLTSAVVILMAITSAGIFGYLSNAFQQQNIKLDQVQREIQVWENKINYSSQQITTLQGQQKDLSSTQNTLITKGNVNNRLLKSVDNRDKQTTIINKKINSLQDSIVVYNGKINDVKNNNISIEREVGGFRFVAEAFGVELKSVVKFFIILIVVVFDPLAVALVISFNQLVIVKRKDEDDDIAPTNNPEDLKNFVDDTVRLRLTEEDLKKLEEVLLNPISPNDDLKEAAKKYEEELDKSNSEPFGEMMIKEDDDRMNIIGQNGNEGLHYEEEEEDIIHANYISKEETKFIIGKMIQEPPYVSDDFTIGPDGAFEMTEEIQQELLNEMIKNNQELGLYDEPYDVENGTEQINEWDVTLMDGLEGEEPFFTEEEIEKILQEEPTEEEIQRNFSTIESNSENIFQEEFNIPVDEAVDNEPELTFEEGQLPDDLLKVLNETQIETFNQEPNRIDETIVQPDSEVEKKN